MVKAWRLITLLSTLGKTYELVMAERLSYVIKKYSLYYVIISAQEGDAQ